MLVAGSAEVILRHCAEFSHRMVPRNRLSWFQPSTVDEHEVTNPHLKLGEIYINVVSNTTKQSKSSKNIKKKQQKGGANDLPPPTKKHELLKLKRVPQSPK